MLLLQAPGILEMQCPKCLGQGAQRAAQGVDLVSWHDTASLAGQ